MTDLQKTLTAVDIVLISAERALRLLRMNVGHCINKGTPWREVAAPVTVDVLYLKGLVEGAAEKLGRVTG